jgi:hypothetical protein
MISMYPKSYFQESEHKIESGRCFVIMPFASQFDPVFASIERALEGPEVNFTCIRTDELHGGGHIIEDILENIAKAEIILADVTGRNANVFYELGIAHMVKDIEKVLILTQNIDEVPFDLQQFRFITYEKTVEGLSTLETALDSTIKEISARSFRFRVSSEESFKFQYKLMGADRAFYDFEIVEIWPEETVAKLIIRQNKHVLGRATETLSDDSYGLMKGEQIELAAQPWVLILEESTQQGAQFRVVQS